MLSESRRKKQRIADDPNNLRWVKDNNKFGQKLLEKMGWKTGAGLGLNEQGRADPLAVRANSGFRGFGCDHKTEVDVHSEHRRNFDLLLNSLKDGGESESKPGSGLGCEIDSNPTSSCSLMNLSKSSRRRIHYSRFAKGKELSTASAIDLATITGDLDKRASDFVIPPESDIRKEENQTNSDLIINDDSKNKKFIKQSFVKSKSSK